MAAREASLNTLNGRWGILGANFLAPEIDRLRSKCSLLLVIVPTLRTIRGMGITTPISNILVMLRPRKKLSLAQFRNAQLSEVRFANSIRRNAIPFTNRYELFSC